MNVEPAPSLCLKYQQQLIDLYNEEKKERYKIEKIYELANSLLVRNITTKEFGLKVNEVFKNANEIFKGEIGEIEYGKKYIFVVLTGNIDEKH